LKASAVAVVESNVSSAGRIPRPSQHVSRNVSTTLAVDVEENNASCAVRIPRTLSLAVVAMKRTCARPLPRTPVMVCMGQNPCNVLGRKTSRHAWKRVAKVVEVNNVNSAVKIPHVWQHAVMTTGTPWIHHRCAKMLRLRRSPAVLTASAVAVVESNVNFAAKIHRSWINAALAPCALPCVRRPDPRRRKFFHK